MMRHRMAALRGVQKIAKCTIFPALRSARPALLNSAAPRHLSILPGSRSTSHVRSLHSTTPLQQSVRRRRRRGGASTAADDGKESTEPTFIEAPDPEGFTKASTAFIDKMYAALRPLLAINDNMILTRGREDADDDDGDFDFEEDAVAEEVGGDEVLRGEYLVVDLGPVDGQYTLQADDAHRHILFLSPISGQHAYQPTVAGDWCCVVDGHNLEGIFVRDLIRTIKGVPKL